MTEKRVTIKRIENAIGLIANCIEKYDWQDDHGSWILLNHLFEEKKRLENRDQLLNRALKYRKCEISKKSDKRIKKL
ncbi:MAG: hypothetical protein COB24_12400 [Hyphomicrobiales bacterium]|nr:MAG: hypothetical protein COB24_12400 [Hyphomicrobiales bacterium]